jgi:hypothetical protein
MNVPLNHMDKNPRAPLEREAVNAIAREWVAESTPDIPRSGYGWLQMRWLMDELRDRCVEETLRQQEAYSDGLSKRLHNAYDMLNRAWWAVAPEYAKRFTPKEQLSEEEKKGIEDAKKILWRRHDPKISFREGLRSEHYVGFDKDGLHEAIADYLAHAYLRTPVLDWIFLDMTISRELCAFGESVKQVAIPGKRDRILGIHFLYVRSQGNLAEMNKVDWNARLEGWNTWFWCALGFPVGLIWACFHWNYTTAGWWITAIYSLIVALYIGGKVLGWIAKAISRLRGTVDPITKMTRLWDSMYEVWTRLAGPVVNPTLVRDAMVKSTNEGAVWDSVSWSLIDRVISTDASVWVVQPIDK